MPVGPLRPWEGRTRSLIVARGPGAFGNGVRASLCVDRAVKVPLVAALLGSGKTAIWRANWVTAGFTIIYSHLQPCTAMYSHLQPFTAIYSHLQPFTVIYSHLLSFTVIYSHLLSFTVIYCDLL